MTNDKFSYFLITKIASICTISKDNVLQVKHTNLLKDVLSNQRKILLLNTNHSCVFVLTRSSLAKFSQCNIAPNCIRASNRTIHPYSFEGHSRETRKPVAETRRRILRVFLTKVADLLRVQCKCRAKVYDVLNLYCGHDCFEHAQNNRSVWLFAAIKDDSVRPSLQ